MYGVQYVLGVFVVVVRMFSGAERDAEEDDTGNAGEFRWAAVRTRVQLRHGETAELFTCFLWVPVPEAYVILICLLLFVTSPCRKWEVPGYGW
jgi:hypothetical protein